jgi:hypothetical protein
MMVLGVGVFRYQQVAYLAREAARFASVHGAEYQTDNAAAIAAGTSPNVTDAYLTNNIVKANAAAMDPSLLSVSVMFNQSAGSTDWDQTNPRAPFTEIAGPPSYNLTNSVSVTVTYQWLPEIFFIGPINLSSTSVMPMCY